MTYTIQNAAKCYICGEPSMCAVNVSPHAASGGMLEPVCPKRAPKIALEAVALHKPAEPQVGDADRLLRYQVEDAIGHGDPAVSISFDLAQIIVAALRQSTSTRDEVVDYKVEPSSMGSWLVLQRSEAWNFKSSWKMERDAIDEMNRIRALAPQKG